jgi:hypothetical protein
MKRKSKKRQSPVVIIHFQPLELYPPIQNFIDYYQNNSFIPLLVVTTGALVKINEFKSGEKVSIKRIGVQPSSLFCFQKILFYLRFYLTSFLLLIKFRPQKVMYFETLSAWPVLVYKKLFPFCKVFIHYHEYTSLNEYAKGMMLNRIFHKMEVRAYPFCYWISHTNQYRVNLFLTDHPDVSSSIVHVLPNYPPLTWKQSSCIRFLEPVKFVYAGAVSTKTMYFEEFCNWILEQNGKATLDIFSLNLSDEAETYLNTLKHSNVVHIHTGVQYDDLSKILKNFHIGLVLYKGHSPNYIYNIPNKLFEYLACGLDVWVPEVMTACKDYITKNTYPKVVMLDYNRLHEQDFVHLINRESFIYKPSQFFMESVYRDIVADLSGADE